MVFFLFTHNSKTAMLNLNLLWVFWEPVPVFEGACITRPALHVFRLFLLLLRPDISPLPKALFPPGPLVLLLRTIPKSAQPLLFTLVEKSWLNAAVCYCTSAHLIIWTTSSSRNSSTGKVKPGMWIIGHLSAGRYSSWGLSRVIFLSPRLLNICCVAYQNTWRISPRWAWRSWGWFWGHPGGWAGPWQWWAAHPTADSSRGFRPARGD